MTGIGTATRSRTAALTRLLLFHSRSQTQPNMGSFVVSAAAAAAAAAALLLTTSTAQAWTTSNEPKQESLTKSSSLVSLSPSSLSFAAAAAATPVSFFPYVFSSSSSSLSSSYFGVFARTITSCQGAALDDDDQVSDDSDTEGSTSSYPFPQLERLPHPDRALKNTHAIFGSLIKRATEKEDRNHALDDIVAIESYDVYKYKPNESDNDNSDLLVVGVVKLGAAVDGHQGVVHGGILSLLLDDVLGYAYESLENPVVPLAVTANLNINFLNPCPTCTTIYIRASLEKRHKRKLHFNVVVSSQPPVPSLQQQRQPEEQQQETVYCKATSLFVIPRHVYDEMKLTKKKVHPRRQRHRQRLRERRERERQQQQDQNQNQQPQLLQE